AADILKQNMVDLYNEGFISHISVHDELIFSVPQGAIGDKAIRRIKEIMEHPTGIDLKVPLVVNVKVGETWGAMSSWG
ncbi:MAG: DNA polymerase, partial [candidate division Zixibacteria bacterium]|nr:DNA polymerase [candidate division Zixibacteria bacterium]